MKIGQRATFKKTLTQADFDCFARLSGDNNPIHVDPEFSARTKFGKPVAHGMLLYGIIGRCLGALLPGRGTIQASQELMFPNPTLVEQEITIDLEIDAFPTSNTAELTTNIVLPDGEMGCLGKTVVWIPGSTTCFPALAGDLPNYESEAQEHRGLSIGQSVDKTRVFTREELGEYLELVEEINPMFSEPDLAQGKGLRDVLLPGGLLGGIVSDLLGTQLPGRGTNWLKQKYQFLNPAYPGEEMCARVEIIRLRPEKELVNLRTTISNQREDIVVAGEALVWVSDLEVSIADR